LLLALPAIALFSCQSMLIYFPRPYSEQALARARAMGITTLEFQTEDGQQIAHLLSARDHSTKSEATLWMITAGNGSLALDYLDDALFWQDAHPGATFLFLDYPGYGACQGNPNPDSITRSIDAIHAELCNFTSIGPIEHIGCFGHSLGAAAALIAADRLEARRIVLISPFTSMADMAEKQFGKWARVILRHNFDNRDRIRSIAQRNNAEVVIFHGDSDELIPPRMPEELAQTFPDTVTRLSIVTGAGHNDVALLAEDSICAEISRPFTH
jgi:pimeloyl-ACP methyl ester carboxylesterase